MARRRQARRRGWRLPVPADAAWLLLAVRGERGLAPSLGCAPAPARAGKAPPVRLPPAGPRRRHAASARGAMRWAALLASPPHPPPALNPLLTHARVVCEPGRYSWAAEYFTSLAGGSFPNVATRVTKDGAAADGADGADEGLGGPPTEELMQKTLADLAATVRRSTRGGETLRLRCGPCVALRAGAQPSGARSQHAPAAAGSQLPRDFAAPDSIPPARSPLTPPHHHHHNPYTHTHTCTHAHMHTCTKCTSTHCTVHNAHVLLHAATLCSLTKARTRSMCPSSKARAHRRVWRLSRSRTLSGKHPARAPRPSALPHRVVVVVEEEEEGGGSRRGRGGAVACARTCAVQERAMW